ncbi:MAG: hypothetical protein KA371_21860 [Acidobacteria bacterium]|nr:hypothetical protein [Acidobacteriota bacterium]
MSSRTFVLSAAAGAVVSFTLGGLIYAVLLADFFAANTTAVGVIKEPPLLWAIALSEVAAATLLTLILGTWARVTGVGAGATVGAVFGLATAIMFDFNVYGTMNMMNLTATLIDPVLSAARFAIAGGAIAFVAARA